ncbi:MAG: hypothetical protein HZC26_01460 [Candidatus Magasanikbacteria bacterium]|nr:hypothetical protein [Candidatus Magasanikbacteria bacterium]
MQKWLKKNFKVWWLQALLAFATFGFTSVLFVYFVKKDVTFFQIFLADFFSYSLIVAYLLFRRTLFSRGTILTGYLLIVVGMLILLLPFPATALLFPYTIIYGLGVIMFFAPYNILYFKSIQRGNLEHMTIYWSIGIITGLVAPLIGSFVLAKFPLWIFISCAVLILLSAAYLTRFVERQKYSYTTKEVLTHIRGLRTLSIIDGSLHKTSLIVVTVFSLQYITTELNFGRFLSIAALAGIIVALPMARISDRWQKRMIFIWPLSIMSAGVVFSFIFVKSFLGFFALALLLKAILSLLEPIRGNVILDKKETGNAITWISRELYLNIGRLMMMGVIAVFIYFGNYTAIYSFIALQMVLYPIILYFKKTYAVVD